MKFLSLLMLPLLCVTAPAHALNIVISNDDGLTSNVKALYEQLKADGHDVIVSVPCHGQSGMGAAIKFLEPLGPLTSNCLNDAARVGDPGAGPMTRSGLTPDFFYVRGTPVMALLYGLDVQAKQRWGKAPDLVLSGPNEGQNVGSVVVTSGTVSNAQYGAIRGIPAIAFSASEKTADNAALANPDSRKVAALASRLVSFLEKKAGGKRLLPQGVALNVNFPDSLDNPKWHMARIGSYDAFAITFVDDLSSDPMTRALGLTLPKAPGVTLAFNTTAPTAEQVNDEAAVYKKAIAVTVMQIGYDHRPGEAKQIARHLKKLLDSE